MLLISLRKEIILYHNYIQYADSFTFMKVVIGGRNKYLINGCNANNTRVQDLFRSVQLNVNNPHFLIMQVSQWQFALVFIYMQ